MRTMLLLTVAGALVGGWFAPQLQEGTDGPCPALEKRLRASLPADSRMAREIAAQTVRTLERMPHGAGCVSGWWKLRLESWMQGGATGLGGR
jgi:hypothetical protein